MGVRSERSPDPPVGRASAVSGRIRAKSRQVSPLAASISASSKSARKRKSLLPLVAPVRCCPSLWRLCCGPSGTGLSSPIMPAASEPASPTAAPRATLDKRWGRGKERNPDETSRNSRDAPGIRPELSGIPVLESLEFPEFRRNSPEFRSNPQPRRASRCHGRSATLLAFYLENRTHLART